LSQAPTTHVQLSCDSACGNVDFRIDGNEWGTIGLLADGTYTTTGFPTVSVGNHTLQVNYLGNATYAPAQSNAVPFIVLAAQGSGGAGFTALPVAVNFGSLTQLFTSVPQTVTLTNNTGTYVQPGMATIAGPNASDFAIVSSPGTSCAYMSLLASGQTCTYQVAFTPSAAGARSASLAINSPASPMLSVALSGEGTAPATTGPVSLSSASLSFTQFGVPQNVTLTNYGNGPLTINGISLGAPTLFAQTNNCGTTLIAQSICTIAVTALANPGNSSTTLTVVDDAAAGPQTLPISYTSAGVGGPNALNFGGWSIGAKGSISASFGLPQKGDGAYLTITGPNASDFTVNANSGADSDFCELAEGIACDPTISFSPTGLGARTATLSLSLVTETNFSGIPVGSVTLTGTGQAAGPNFVISNSLTDLTVNSYAFVQDYLGSPRSTTFTIRNSGTVPLTLNTPVSSGAEPQDFAGSESCATIALAGTCVLTVTSTPSQLGPVSATIGVTDSTGTVQRSVLVTDSGLPNPPSISPGSLDFSAVQIGTQSPSQAVTITSFNNDPVTATVTPPFLFTQGNSCAQTPCTLYVAFLPTAVQGYSGALTVTDNLAEQGQTIELSGTGLPSGSPVVSLSPSSLSFAERTVGSTSIAQSVTLSNTGNAVLNISSIALGGADPGDYFLTNGCGSTLAAGANCSFTVSFAPTAAGTRTASVQIVSNASTSPDSVGLSGTAQAVPLADAPLTGVVMAGTAPVSGAHVYLFAAGKSGYGGPSAPLLSAANTGLSDAVGPYVVSASDGSFTLTGDYSCTAGQQVYVYAAGGNSGFGANASAALMGVVGACPTAATAVTLNEATTVAAAYALSGFMTDAAHVSSSGTALALTSVANGFQMVGNLVKGSTGVAWTATQSPQDGVVPQAEIDTLADILGTCTESNGSGCATLFGLVTPPGGTAPADTVQAALDIAHNPGNQVAALFGLPALSTAAFQPVLPSAPNDFTLAVVYAGAGEGQPSGIVVDGSGNVWTPGLYSVTNGTYYFYLSEFNGAHLISGYAFTGGGLSQPGGLAIDESGNVWVSDYIINSHGSASQLAEFNSAGTPVTSSAGYLVAQTFNASSVAIDGSGYVWLAENGYPMANDFAAELVKVDPATGNVLSPAGGYTGGGLVPTAVLAMDGTGHVWAAGQGTVSEFSTATGLPVSPSTGYTGGGLGTPSAMAVDGAGAVWVVNAATISQFFGQLTAPGSVTKLNASGAAVSPSTGYTTGSTFVPMALAIDGAGNVWVVTGACSGCVSQRLVEFNGSTGSVVSGSTGYAAGQLTNEPRALAIDGTGNLWLTNYDHSLTEFIGLATPVATPLATAAKNNMLGTRP
jgi:hypothetical protein